MNSETLGMTVENTGFLVDRLGQDCGPLQYIRELTQNAIEAILKLDNPTGEVHWDLDRTLDAMGQSERKLCIIDNGVGMTGEEQLQFINKLSSSNSEQSFDKNFGVGAKIAGVTRNHGGLIYQSWKDDVGSMLHLWRDPVNGAYGAKQQVIDGIHSHYITIANDIKPSLIKTHGTKVVLLGNKNDEDTTLAPIGAKLPTKWIRRYLNSRYFCFPEGITVRAIEWDNEKGILRQVTGQKEYLKEHSAASGTVELQGAKAHWWILDADLKKLTNNFGHYAYGRHVAALYQNELYELIDGNSATQRLSNFGIYLGHERVVLYVEPDTTQGNVTANTARTELLLNNERLPWADWANQFRQQLPEEIEQLVREKSDSLSANNNQDAILERLKNLKDLYEISKYRPAIKGSEKVENFDAPGEKPAVKDGTTQGNSSSGGKGGSVGDFYSFFAKSGEKSAEEIVEKNYPKVNWVSVATGSREPNDMDDRAARYVENQNLILMNLDFRVFQDMIARWAKKYQVYPEAETVVTLVVREWFEQQVMECILGLLSIKNSAKWNIDDIRKAWSEEALTTAVMSRYHIDQVISRNLGQKLGSLKDLAE